MNKSDSERIAGFLEKRGYSQSPFMEKADLIVVNMCSIRQTAVDRIFGLKPKFQKLRTTNRKLQTILTGCFLLKDKKKFATFFDYILKTPDFPACPLFQSNKTQTGVPDYFKIKPKYSKGKVAYLPVSFGCNNFCSYCVVPYTRGREICRPAKEIIKETKELIKKGYQQIWLLGQNVNSYKDKNINFPKLLKSIANIAGDFKLYFLSAHPKDFSDELINLIADNEKMAKHIHLPVQSGDNEILKKMNRKYSVQDYKKLVKKIRRKIPEVFLSTDAIVGFPGETKKQFENTAKLFKEMKFDKAYLAMFSPRSGTLAAKMKDNIPKEEKRKRWLKLNKIIERNKNKKLVVILGPTASGKSKLAIKLAKKFNGEIVSADSKQIYKGMDIGTAKVNKKEMQSVPHYLLNIVSAKKQFNVAEYQKLAIAKIKDIQKRGKVPFLVGGSPFYLFSVIEGWFFPKMKADLKYRRRLEKKSTKELFNLLKKIDKKRAENIDENNKRRLVRALEIAETLGKVPKLEEERQFDCLLIGLDLSKKELIKRINQRVDKMVKLGLEKEVKKLIKNKYLTVVSQTIGYQEWLPYFNGKISRKEVIENIRKNTQQFVKHQITWFKKKDIKWIKNESQAENLIKNFYSTSSL